MDEHTYSGGLTVPAKKGRILEIDFRPPHPTLSLSFQLLLLFLLLLYSNAALLVPELEALQPAQTVGLAALCILFIERTLMRRGFELVWPESHLLLAFLGAASLSCFTALWMQYAVEATINLVKFVAIYFLIVNSVESESRLRLVLWTMVVGGLFPALGALQHYRNGLLVEGSRAAWVGIFANPNELAYSLIILLPLAFFLGMTGQVWARLSTWAIIGLYIAAIFVSYSRGGMLALVVVLTLLGLRRGGRSLRILTIVLLAGSAIFIASFWSRGQGFTDLSGDITFQQRLATIRAGLAMFADRPLLGVGLNCSILGWSLYAPPDVPTHGWLHNHNTFSQVLSETGVLGFVPFLLVFAVAQWRTYRFRLVSLQQQDARLALLASALEVSLWGFLACGLSGGYVLSWFPYLLVALVSSMKRIHDQLDF